jgi:2-O-methyltransferase
MVMKKIVWYAWSTCLVYGALSAGYDESNIHELIKSFLPDDAIIVEAGAHYGTDTVIMAKLFPKGIIYSFEPTPTSFKKLEEKVSGLPNVHCYQCALGNKNGKATFYIGPNEGGSNSLLPPALIAHYFTDKMSVDCVVLDQWAKRNKVQHIDFMWLDMEGNELRVLKSSPKILKTVKAVYTEINFQEFWKRNTYYYDLRTFLEKQGFTEVWKSVGVRDVANHAKTNSNEYVAMQGNALFVRLSDAELTM